MGWEDRYSRKRGDCGATCRMGAVRDQAISDGEIDLDAGDNPDE